MMAIFLLYLQLLLLLMLKFLLVEKTSEILKGYHYGGDIVEGFFFETVVDYVTNALSGLSVDVFLRDSIEFVPY